MANNSQRIEEILKRISDGDHAALGTAFQHFRGRLKRAVRMRLDPRMAGRIDPSDVLQEAFLDASRRLPEWVADTTMPLYVWFRLLTNQRLVDLQRRHLRSKKRAASNELSIDVPLRAQTSAIWLTAQLLDQHETPFSAASRGELRKALRETLDQMEPLDREVLAMRHFELLTNQEISQLLGITKAAASNRYIRALKRLRAVLGSADESHE